MTQALAEAGWLGKRSGVLTCVAACLAVVATAAAFIYLNPAGNDTWLNLALVVLALAAPLGAKPPLTRQRLLVGVLVWMTLGVPGGYVFGSSVFYVGVLLGAALLVDAAIGRGSVNASGGAPVTSGAGKANKHV